jgi:ubiquinone/menaquinone biosynthesis C-methylase UbiE
MNMERIPENEAIAQLEQARRFNQVMGRSMVQHEYRKLAELLVKLGLPRDGSVLDVGTGTGYVALEIARYLKGHGRVVGLDLSEAMLSLAAENALTRGLQAVVEWKLGDASVMPFSDGEFDAVISSGSLHHWQAPLKTLNEIGRVVKPHGKVILRVSKRLPGTGIAALMAALIGFTLPADFRAHYWGSIRSSYTPAELQVIVDNSRLKGSRIVEDLLDLMIIKE